MKFIYVKIIFFTFLLSFISIIVVQNSDIRILLKVLWWNFHNISILLLIVCSFITGFLLGLIFFYYQQIHKKKEYTQAIDKNYNKK